MTKRIVRGARSWRFGVAALAVLAAFAGRNASAAGEANDEVVPWLSADTVLYVELPRPAALLDRLTDDRLRAPLAALPSIKEALAKDEFRKLHEVAGLVASKLDTSPDKAFRSLTGGGAVFAVEAGQGGAPNAFLIVTPTDPSLLKKANEALLDLARSDAEAKGKPDPVKSVEYRGLTGYQVEKTVYAIVKDCLIVADRAATAKAVADRVLDGLGGKKPITELVEWSGRQNAIKADTLAWAFVRTERLRQLDPKKFGKGGGDRKPQEMILFGGWLDAVRKAPWLSASADWSESRMAATLTLPVPAEGRPAVLKGFVPPKGSGAPALATPPGTVASLSLWRDLATVWEARAELLPPEDVQKLAKLDTFAGQFFGGRDFGTGVLGALGSDWRLVVALQDYAKMSPVPDVKLPAFALVADVKPDDDDFAERLKVAYQSFIGLANLGAAQTKAPPLELGSETFEGVTISTSHFMPARKAPEGQEGAGAKAEPVHYRHNYSPSAAQVGRYFVIGSSVGLTRDLVKALKSPGKPSNSTLVAEADGATLATLVELNRDRLVMQNMLDKGHDKGQAEAEVGLLAALLRYLGRGRLSVLDAADATRVGLEFSLGK